MITHRSNDEPVKANKINSPQKSQPLSRSSEKDAASQKQIPVVPESQKQLASKPPLNALHRSGLVVPFEQELLDQNPAYMTRLLNDPSWNLNSEQRQNLQSRLLDMNKAKMSQDHHNSRSTEQKQKLDNPPAANDAPDIPRLEKHLAALESSLQRVAANQSQTVDGYYSEIWGADKAPLAAGPMGATLSGLRPMGLWQFTEVIQSAMRDNLHKKQLMDLIIDVNESKKLQKLESKEQIKTEPLRPSFSNNLRDYFNTHFKSADDMYATKLKIAINKVFNSVVIERDNATKRKPNRDNKELDEYILPGPGSHYGPGGLGGSRH